MSAKRHREASEIDRVQERDGELQLGTKLGREMSLKLSNIHEIEQVVSSSSTSAYVVPLHDSSQRSCRLFISPTVWMRLRYYSRFRKLLRYLDRHLDCRIRLSDLAEATCMSPAALSRLFKTKIGITLREFVGAYKAGMAHEMMVTSDLSITEIADALGFVSLSTFERTFRRITGQTPSQYRVTILDGRGMLPRE